MIFGSDAGSLQLRFADHSPIRCILHSRLRGQPRPSACSAHVSSYRPGRLSDFIEDFWLYDGYVAPHARELILPRGTFEVVFNLRDDELRIYDPRRFDRFRRFSGAIVSGPYAGCFASDAAEEVFAERR